MRASEKRKNNILIGVLLGVVVLMGIAYAAFASNLNITGTSSMSENWCIGFDSTRTSDYQATSGITGGTTPTGSMSFSGDSCGGNLKTTASLNASFKQPEDKVEYTLTIGNKGTLAAAIESINVDGDSVTSDTTITKGNIKYIIEMPQSTSLAVNATTTMKVTAMFQNDTNISSSSNEQQTISIGVNAVQDDGSGGFTPTPASFTGTIYRWNTKDVSLSQRVVTGDVYCVIHPEYGKSCDFGLSWDSESDCTSANPGLTCELGTISMSDTFGTYITEEEYPTYQQRVQALGHNYYLKHVITDNRLTASYVCFVYNNAEHCLKGGDGGASFAANTAIIQDYQAFYSLSNVSYPSSSDPGCKFHQLYSSCYGGGFNEVGANSYGHVGVYGSSSENCYVGDTSTDFSFCRV